MRKQILQRHQEQKSCLWQDVLRDVVCAYNSSPGTVNKVAPCVVRALACVPRARPSSIRLPTSFCFLVLTIVIDILLAQVRVLCVHAGVAWRVPTTGYPFAAKYNGP